MSPLVTVEDYPAAQEWFADNGFGDGLPIVPPTPELVDAMLGGRDRDRLLGRVGDRPEGVTVEQAAVCAVLAGCRPEYFPVVLATWEAVLEPAFNPGSVLGSSGGTALTAVVSGSYAAAIGMNSGHNLFGPGNRPNATIGRAVRLGVMDVLGYRPGVLDGAAFGSQARYTAHFAEAPGPWRPLRERLGFDPESTTVTVAVTDAPRQVTHILSGDADNVLAMLTAAMKDPSHSAAGRGTTFFLVLGPEHTGILHAAGWTPESIAAHLAETTRITPEELAAGGAPLGPDRLPVEHGRRMTLRADGTLPTAEADEIHVVTAGGTGAGWSAVVFGYTHTGVFRPVTKEVRL
jgi:hypothetical protein